MVELTMGRRKKPPKDPRSQVLWWADWDKEAKEALGKTCEEIGEEEEDLRYVAEHWDLAERARKSLGIEAYEAGLAYLQSTVDDLSARDPRDPVQWWHQYTSTSGSGFLYGTGTSSATVALISDDQEQRKLHEFLERPEREKREQQDVLEGLRRLSADLVVKHQNVWQIWTTTVGDPPTDILISMREVVRHTIEHLSAPGQPFRGEHWSEQRKERMKWLVDNLVASSAARRKLQAADDDYATLYRVLSNVGKGRRTLPRSVLKPHLLQAQAFLASILGSIDWEKAAQMSLTIDSVLPRWGGE